MLELSDFYIPKEIPHREKQIKEIRDIFLNFKKYNSGSNLAIFGSTGSGKTTIIKKVIEEENNSIYVCGADTKTAYKTIKAIFNLKIQTQEELLRRTIDKLIDTPKIIIIDEIDKVKNVNSLFNDLNTIYRKTMIPIIIITLKHNIISEMPIDARKTLYFEKMVLPSYNAIELKDILISRLKQVREEIPTINEGTINYISAIAGRQGSARALINIIFKCIQKRNFSQDFIDEIYKQMLHEDCFDFIDEINDTEREFLKYLIESCDDKEETTSEILENKIGLSNARISQLLNTFEKYSLIKTYHRNLGRKGGRKRIIKFCSKEIYDELKKRNFGI